MVVPGIVSSQFSGSEGLGIGLALITGVINAANTQVLKKQGEDAGRQAGFQVVSIWSRFLLCLPFLFVMKLGWGSVFFVVVSVASGFFYAANNLSAYYAIMMGPVAIIWTMAWLGGPSIAIMWAVYPGNEAWTWQQYTGMALFLACFPAMGLSTYFHNRAQGVVRRIQKYFFVMCLSAFFFGSIAGYMNKYANGYNGIVNGTPAAYAVLVSFSTACGFSLFHGLRRSRFVFGRGNVGYGVLSGVLTAAQIGLMSHGIRYVEVARFFPTVACTAILLSTGFSLYMQKEVPSILTVAGIVTCIGAIIFFAMG